MRRALLLAAALVVLALPSSAAAVGIGTIEGTVSPASVAAETEVCLVPTGPNAETCTSARPDGTYRLTGVPTSTPERVVFLPSHRSGYVRQYFDHVPTAGEAQTIVAGKEPVKGVDADLALGGVIGGKVTAAGSGDPLAEAEVCLTAAGTGESAGCTSSNGLGNYLLTTIPSGSYDLFFRGDGASAAYAPEYYSNQPDRAHANTVNVKAGETVLGFDEELDVGARIEGTVSSAVDGSTLEGTTVCLFAAASTKAQRCTASLAGGHYAFPGLASGQYTVGFDLGSAEIAGADPSGSTVGGFLPQFYRGATTRATAQPITLLAPATASGIDASLQVPPTPPPPPPPIPVVAPVVAAPPPVAVPPTKKGCKKGYRKQKVKGKTRCVKVHKKKHKGKKSPKKRGGKAAAKRSR